LKLIFDSSYASESCKFAGVFAVEDRVKCIAYDQQEDRALGEFRIT
jgi:hypothetical protein